MRGILSRIKYGKVNIHTAWMVSNHTVLSEISQCLDRRFIRGVKPALVFERITVIFSRVLISIINDI
jgi:hypothetical protein